MKFGDFIWPFGVEDEGQGRGQEKESFLTYQDGCKCKISESTRIRMDKVTYRGTFAPKNENYLIYY